VWKTTLTSLSLRLRKITMLSKSRSNTLQWRISSSSRNKYSQVAIWQTLNNSSKRVFNQKVKSRNLKPHLRKHIVKPTVDSNSLKQTWITYITSW
jgi:hypothetical protein